MKKITPQMLYQAYRITFPDEWGVPARYGKLTKTAKVRYTVMAAYLAEQTHESSDDPQTREEGDEHVPLR